jgi:sulfate/thiosulfate-binding protein
MKHGSAFIVLSNGEPLSKPIYTIGIIWTIGLSGRSTRQPKSHKMTSSSHLTRRRALALAAGALPLTALGGHAAQADAADKLLNVSYDPTAALYADYNKLFAAYWAKKTGTAPALAYSHGGSGAQARAVIEGLQADVVTLALSYDIDAIAKTGLIAKNWQSRLPDNSTPYTSTIVFLVRAGNPKGIKDWGDLIKPGVQVITPNPKTSGGARWNVLAAWSYALKANNGSTDAAKAYLKAFFANVPVLDAGAHGSTLTFTQRGIGDVLVGWENDAFLSIKEAGAGSYEIVAPSISILAEPPVAVVDKNVAKHGTTELAEAYLKYLYTPEAQDLIGKSYYRPRDQAAAAKYASQFPKIEMVTVETAFGGWQKAQPEFFADGGIFDQVYSKGT